MAGLSNTLYSGASGLINHQKRLDVVGNNLSNVNTYGYRAQEHQFNALLSQQMRVAVGSGNGAGSVNPLSLGLGTGTSAVGTNFTSGGYETTNRTLDCAIEGNGFFVVRDGGGDKLTRAGHFYVGASDAAGMTPLLQDRGVAVRGYNAVNGAIDLTQPLQDIVLPGVGSLLLGQSTTTAAISGNLNTVPESGTTTGTTTSAVDVAGYLAPGEDYTFSFELHGRSDPNATTPPTAEEVVSRPVTLDFQSMGERLLEDGATRVNAWRWTLTDRATGAVIATDLAQFHLDAAADGTHAAGDLASGEFTVAKFDQTVNGERVRFDTFALDMGRMTSVGDVDAAVADPPFLWSVDGADTGWLTQTVTLYETLNRYELVNATDASGNPLYDENGDLVEYWTAIPSTEARSVVMAYALAGAVEEGGANYTDWQWKSNLFGADGARDGGTIRFDSSGEWVATATDGAPTLAYDFTELRQVAMGTSLHLREQDGYPHGYLEETTIDQNGRIWGVYSNGVNDPLAQLALANVTNPQGLAGLAGTRYAWTPSAGELMVGAPNQWFTGENGGQRYLSLSVRSGTLETSNTSTEVEFVNLITTQRGYQVNTRSVTAADEMLQLLVQLKR